MKGSQKPQQDEINPRIQIPYNRTKKDFENHLTIHLSARLLFIEHNTTP